MKKCELSIPETTRIALGVSEANRLHQYATAQAEMAVVAGKNAVLAVLRLGRLLKDLKAATVHGEWETLFRKQDAGTKTTHVSFLNTNTDSKPEPRFQFEFSKRTAQRYMRCYQEAVARLGQDERPALDMGLDGEAVETLPELVKKATGNAVTPPANDAEFASGERRQQERRPGRPPGPARNHLAEPGKRPCRCPRKPGTGHDGRRGWRTAGRGIKGTEKAGGYQRRPPHCDHAGRIHQRGIAQVPARP